MKKLNIVLSAIGAVAVMGMMSGCGGGTTTTTTPVVAPVPGASETALLTDNYYNWIKQMYFDGERMCNEWEDWLAGQGFNDVHAFHFEVNKECHDFGKIEDNIYCTVEVLAGTVPKTCALGWDTISKEAKETDMEVLYAQFKEEKEIEESNK